MYACWLLRDSSYVPTQYTRYTRKGSCNVHSLNHADDSSTGCTHAYGDCIAMRWLNIPYAGGFIHDKCAEALWFYLQPVQIRDSERTAMRRFNMICGRVHAGYIILNLLRVMYASGPSLCSPTCPVPELLLEKLWRQGGRSDFVGLSLHVYKCEIYLAWLVQLCIHGYTSRSRCI